jgi:hypothetical protein
MVVSGHANGVVLVIDHGCRVADLQRLRERLEVLPTPVLGYIYNRAPLRGSHYGYGYGIQPEEPAPARRRRDGIRRTVAAAWVALARTRAAPGRTAGR